MPYIIEKLKLCFHVHIRSTRQCVLAILIMALVLVVIVPCFASETLPPASAADVQLKQLNVSADAVLYSQLHYTRPIADAVFSILVYGLILQTGLAAKLQDMVRKKFKNRLVQIALYYFLISAIAFIGCMPYLFFYSHWLPVHFDLSKMSDLEWFIERSKRFLVNTALGGIYWSLFFLLVQKFRQAWHLILFAVLAPLSAFFVFVWPITIDPLFNDFTELSAGSLRTYIKELATKAGIPDADILVADKSRQTKELNAYVTGIGPSARIVLWDTILAEMPENELLTVVAHETGHYVLLHVYKGYAISMVALFLGLLAAGLWAPGLVKRLPRRWGLSELTDLTLIPVVVLMTAPTALLLSPLESSVSRMFEHEADVFALKLTRQPVSLANAFITLAQKDLIDPHPPEWVEFWFFSHPSLGKRIDFALTGLQKPK